MDRVSNQVIISVVSAAISWAQISLLGRTIDSDIFSLYLAMWGIYGYISFCIFALLDSIQIHSENMYGKRKHAHFVRFIYFLLNMNLRKMWATFFLPSLALLLILSFKYSKALLLCLCLIAALSQFPSQKVEKDWGGPSALNRLFLWNNIFRLLMTFPIVIFYHDKEFIIPLLFSMIVFINMIAISRKRKHTRDISLESIRLNLGVVSKVILFWGIFFCDTTFIRFYLSASDATTYLLLSFIIKGFVMMQILPLSHAVMKYQAHGKQAGKRSELVNSIWPIVCIWLTFSFAIVVFQPKILQFVTGGASEMKVELTIGLLLLHLSLGFTFVILESIPTLTAMFSILAGSLLISAILFGSYHKLSAVYLMSLISLFPILIFSRLLMKPKKSFDL